MHDFEILKVNNEFFLLFALDFKMQRKYFFLIYQQKIRQKIIKKYNNACKDMDYNDLKIIAERKKITIKELSDAIGMTSTGLKRSIEGESMSMKTVRELCKIMEISIAEFFGEEPVHAPSVASERVPYSFNAVPKNGTTSTTVETLVSHIAWLQEEIDRLRSSAQKGKKTD